jgi:hypothetical protein
LAFAFCLALPVCTLGPRDVPRAEASTSILMSMDELVGVSSYVVVGTALERYSVWEDIGGRRIVTYTRMRIDDQVVGSPGAEIMVRTLGGVVGRVGQQVAGEAAISIGSTSLLFLAQAEGAIVVTGMAQGHYPIVSDAKGSPRLAGSPDTGTLLPRRGPVISAREQLMGSTLDSATQAVKRTRRALDGKK